jgi:hypothetical protein
VGRFGLPIIGANLASVAACSILSFVLADRVAFEMTETSPSEPEAVATGQILNSKYSLFR